jgi:hypothetical protein
VRAFNDFSGTVTLTAYVVCAQPHTDVTVEN